MAAKQHISLPWLQHGTVAFLPDNRGLGSFRCGEAFHINMLPAKIGLASEATALLVRCRVHTCQSIKSWEVNTESRLPFGSEPWIFRDWILAGNHLRTVSDIRVGGVSIFNRLESDSMDINGQWSRISILTLPDPENPVPAETVITPDHSDNTLFTASAPPLTLIIESSDGTKLEICTGEDLWRSMDGAGSYTLVKTETGLRLTRILGQWPDGTQWAQRTWRRKWHIAWSAKTKKTKSPTPDYTEVIELDKLDLQESAQKSISGNPCMMADAAMKMLRQKIRNAAAGKHQHILLRGWRPGFCTTASHCGRSNEKQLLHWDITEMLEFWYWANRQLARGEGTFSVEPPTDAPFKDLPSLQGLMYPETL